MASKRRQQRAARTVQAECGADYQEALNFVRVYDSDIEDTVRTDDGVDWRVYGRAAASLYRRLENDD
jgi:hypothetical protein